METSPVNLRSVSESNYVKDRSVPEEKKDLETIQSEENENSKEHDDLSTCGTVPIGKEKKQSSENLENLELLQKSTDAMNQLLDNMSNSKVNSKMETKKPESSETLIPETNMENVKSALNVEDSGVAPTNVTERDLPPLRFHKFHGEYVKMSKDYSTAQIVAPKIQSDLLYLHKRKFIVFSSRPIAINEKVYLRLEKYSWIRVDFVQFGFLDCNPNTLIELEFWERKLNFKYFSPSFNSETGIFHFYVKPSGEVCCFMNNIPKMLVIFEKVNINTPLWVVIKIPHNVTTVKFIDSPKENKTEELKPSSVEKPSPTTSNTLTEEAKLRTVETADLEKKTVENERSGSTTLGGGTEVAPTNVTVKNLNAVRFHRVHGEYIKMSKDYCMARVEIPEISETQLDQSIVCKHKYILFSSRPIAIDEKVYLRLKTVPKSFEDLVGFGLTTNDPITIESCEWYPKWLKYFSDSFSHKDNIFHFCVKSSGELCFFRNDEHIGSLDNININAPFWAVIKLTHNVTTVKVVDSPKENETDELEPPSVEKPSPHLTNALDEPKRHFGYFYSLNLNLSTVANACKPKVNAKTSKLKAYANAFKPKANIENAKKFLEEKGTGVAPTNVTVQDLHPVRFHRVHGKYIKMSKDYCTARVEIPETSEIQLDQLIFCNHNYILFSSRPIAIDEKVYLRLETVPKSFRDRVGLGLTTHDPNTIKSCEWYPKWLKYFSDSFNDKDNIHFCLKPSGEMCFFMNDEHIGSLDITYINAKYWAVIKLTHNVTTVKVIDSPKENETEELKPPSVEKPSPSTTNALTDLGKNNQKWDIEEEETKQKANEKADLEKKTVENEGSTALGGGSGVAPTNVTVQDLHPVRFHRVHGEYIKMSKDYCMARVETPETSDKQCDVSLLGKFNYTLFSSRPIAINEKVYLRLETVSMSFVDLVVIGLTNRDPNTIKSCEWYLTWFKYISNSFIGKDNIFHLFLKASGEICFFRNDEYIGFMNKININTPHWVVIQLARHVTTVKVIDSLKESETEELKSSKQTTNVLDEPKRHFGNINDLNLNLTTDREKRESSKAFKPRADIENTKRPLEEEDCATTPTVAAMKVLTPLRFHRVHGQFIKISNDYCIAQLPIPLDKPLLVTHECFAFSSRPVAINEKVYLRLRKTSTSYIDPFGFGFTDCDPNIVADFLPRLCQFRTCIFGNCLNYLPNHFSTEVTTFYFFVKPSGEVCYGINNKDIGCLSKVINIKIPLWGLIKLSNNISSVKLTESPKENETEDLKSLSEPLQLFPTKINTESRENQKPIISKTPAPSSGITTEKSTVSWSNGTDLRFHSVHGKYIKLSSDKTIAKCEMPAIEPYSVAHECYVFSSRPVDINEKVHLKLEKVSEKYFNAFSFGFTDCDPSIIPNIMNRLCPTSPCILGNCLFDLSSQYCVKDNYMHFYVNKSGEIHFGINEEEKGVCYRGVNTSSRVWAVIKVTNSVSSVRLERKKQDSFQSFFTEEAPPILKVSSTTKEDETGASSKNIKRDGDDENKNSPANCNMLTGKLRTEVTTNTKGQTLFDWGVESTVRTETEFKETESKTVQTSEKSFKSTLQASTSNTPANQIQSTSSIDVENNIKSADYCVEHFVKLVEYQLHIIPEDRRMKCMQKILEEIDTASK